MGQIRLPPTPFPEGHMAGPLGRGFSLLNSWTGAQASPVRGGDLSPKESHEFLDILPSAALYLAQRLAHCSCSITC